jgi:Asp-tRNA(Asn)/Glu-tRNA(Gln) amidotransferase A subunit family amidase
MDLTALTISEAAAALQRGETTAEAYAEALLARAAAHADLNAFIHHDPAQVRGRGAWRRPAARERARRSVRCTASRLR